MKTYSNSLEAIIDLHEKGFTEDFQHLGKNILWLQQNLLLQPNDYLILESHYVNDQAGKCRKISAVVTNTIYVKGIIISPKIHPCRTKPKRASINVLTIRASYKKTDFS